VTGGAQPVGQPATERPAAAAQDQTAQHLGEDPLLAACLLISGRKQIEKSKFARDRSKVDEVKSFAQAEIDEHEGMKAKLARLGYEYPTTPRFPGGQGQPGAQPAGSALPPGTSPTPVGTPGQPGTLQPGALQSGAHPPAGRTVRPGVGQPGALPSGTTQPGTLQPGTTPGTATQPGVAGTQPALPAGATGSQPLPAESGMPTAPPLIAVGRLLMPPGAGELIQTEHEVAERCIANFQDAAKRKMTEKGQLKFEKAYIGDQLYSHYALLDHAQVFIKKSTPQMKPALQEALRIIEQHITSLEQIMDRLDTMKESELRGNG